MRSIYNPLIIGALGLALSGCPGKPAEAPKKEDYNHNVATVNTGVRGRVFLIDEDRDGHVDYIHDEVFLFEWATPEYKKERGVPESSRIKEMTPEMREAASTTLRLQNELDYQMAKSLHEGSDPPPEKPAGEGVGDFLGGPHPGMIRK